MCFSHLHFLIALSAINNPFLDWHLYRDFVARQPKLVFGIIALFWLLIFLRAVQDLLTRRGRRPYDRRRFPRG